jgi:hypothetical protein
LLHFVRNDTVDSTAGSRLKLRIADWRAGGQRGGRGSRYLPD